MNMNDHNSIFMWKNCKLDKAQMFINKGMDREQCILIVEYYSAIKRSKLLMHTTGMNLTITVVSERGRTVYSVYSVSIYIKF